MCINSYKKITLRTYILFGDVVSSPFGEEKKRSKIKISFFDMPLCCSFPRGKFSLPLFNYYS
jgi:hypothetical protein